VGTDRKTGENCFKRNIFRGDVTITNGDFQTYYFDGEKERADVSLSFQVFPTQNSVRTGKLSPSTMYERFQLTIETALTEII